MIEFATLFLGLVFGPQQVELLVHESVGAIEISLDHQVVGHLNQPPWQLTVDFGEELAPHVLEAVAFSGSGTEVGRVDQWLNTSTQHAEVSILVGRNPAGEGMQAQVAWETVTERIEPESVGIELDGVPLAVADPKRFELPRVDLEHTHLLRVELRFSDSLDAVAEAVFGGPYTDRVATELTSMPILLEGRRKLPSSGQMQDWFSVSGELLQVRAVEEGRADILVVRDLATIQVFRQQAAKLQADALNAVTGREELVQVSARDWVSAPRIERRLEVHLKKDHELRFVTPVARQVERQGYRYQLFPPSPRISRQDGHLLWLFASILPRAANPQHQRLADAVAVAGMEAAKSGRRRIVLLIVGPDPVDHSQLSPSAALGLLRQLRVPIAVWTPNARASAKSAWGPVATISSAQKLVGAYSALSKQLDRQHIVWLEGLHLPQTVSLTPKAEGIRLVE
jgi:hypothetical protein